MDTNRNYILIIIEGLSKKSRILDDIIELNKVQRALVESEKFDMDAFDSNMNDKSDKIEELSALDDGFTSVYDRIKKEIAENKDMYAEEIRSMQRLISEITDKVTNIQAEEERIKQKAQMQFDRLKKEANDTKRSAAIASNYYKSMTRQNTEPQFMDKKK